MKKQPKNILKVLLAISIALALFFTIIIIFKNRNAIVETVDIEIVKAQDIYSARENIIFSGVAQKNTEIWMYFNGKIGMTRSDENGKWSVNLGKLQVGEYGIQFLAKNSSIKNSIASIYFQVSAQKKSTELSLNSALKSLTASVSSILSSTPEEVTTVNKETPQVLQDQWNLVK